MAFAVLVILVWISLLIKVCPELDVLVIEEIFISDGDPIKFETFGELSVDLLLFVFIYRAIRVVVESGCCREKAYVVKEVRIVLGDVK